MKKKVIAVGLFGVVLLSFTAGASAASTLERISANLNHGITFLLNGSSWTPKDANGNKATPISYQGTTYVPLRAVAEATGAEVTFDSAKQQIVLETGKGGSGSEEAATGVKVSFSSDNVSHVQIGIDKSGVTRNKEDLLFGETQYEAAFTVSEVNVAGAEFGFKVKAGAKKMGILLGYKANEEDVKRTAKYTIKDSTGQTLASGQIKDGTVESNEIVVPTGETEFTVHFESGSTSSKGAGFLIWDESWTEN